MLESSKPRKRMAPSSQARRHIRATIFHRLAQFGDDDFVAAQARAMNVFFDLSLEYESLRDFKTLCVLVPDLCLNTPASLYLRGPKGTLQLRRTSSVHGIKNLTFPEPTCPVTTNPIRQDNFVAFPVCEIHSESRLLGVLCLHRNLDQTEELFFQDYARRVAQVLAVKQAAVSNRQRLTFINHLVRDIGHNVIVPNMHFKLLFMQMERQIARLGRRIESLIPVRPGDPDLETRRELPRLVEELRSQQTTISRRFQQSSLFLESLLRRSHFEKGRYDLQLRPCKFKSQIIEPQIERFRPLLRAQGVSVDIAPDVRIDEDMIFEADLGLMSQVFANLLSNAVKYTQAVPGVSGPGEKHLFYGWKSEPGAFGSGQHGVRLFVATTGPVIPGEDVSRLFDPDFRSADANGVEGSGHGLFFVKQIVELHKGRVSYSSDPPLNIFSIVLPGPRNGPAPAEAGSCSSPF
jgi:signal transduction histidine kinase